MTQMNATNLIDDALVEQRVNDMYRQVAEDPDGEFHFEIGRGLAERLGYPSELLDRVPAEAVKSFAGVGFFFDLAELRPGEQVLDLGSGTGTDLFAAAAQVGARGQVTGLDITDAQLAKAERLRRAHGFESVHLVEGRIEETSH
jgi:arsenite methyltransferase